MAKLCPLPDTAGIRAIALFQYLRPLLGHTRDLGAELGVGYAQDLAVDGRTVLPAFHGLSDRRRDPAIGPDEEGDIGLRNELPIHRVVLRDADLIRPELFDREIANTFLAGGELHESPGSLEVKPMGFGQLRDRRLHFWTFVHS